MPSKPTPAQSTWHPRQSRAVQTRLKIYEAAMAEMERVGIEEARMADIISAAGVAWGSFYRYFRTKEDVLLEAAVRVAQVFADFCDIATSREHPVEGIIVSAVSRAANTAPHARPLWEATFRVLIEDSAAFRELLESRGIPSPEQVLTELIHFGQRRGEIRDAYPADVVAEVILTAIWANMLREGPAGTITDHLRGRGAGGGGIRRHLVTNLLVGGLSTPRTTHVEPPPAPHERIGRRGSVPIELGEPNSPRPTSTRKERASSSNPKPVTRSAAKGSKRSTPT